MMMSFLKRLLKKLLIITAMLFGSLALMAAPKGLDKAKGIHKKNAQALLNTQGVEGVGIGEDVAENATLVIFTSKDLLPTVPSHIDGVKVVKIKSGKIKALKKGGKGKPGTTIDPTQRFARPVPIGVSVGHYAITAGTIGARVKNQSSYFILSNNHVLANENLAMQGDSITQPGAYDGGVVGPDNIATLFDFEPLVFASGACNPAAPLPTVCNFIDAAIATTSLTESSNATPADGYGAPKTLILAPSVNAKVKKYGRTTGLTNGRIQAINVAVNVGYDAGVATFVDQIVIGGGGFSAGGDSGSLVVSNDRSNKDRPVGLLFAGSSSVTIANPIAPVLTRFNVTIDGK